MKILQVTNFFKPSWEAGGVTRVVYEISKNLTSKGNEVTVYTTDGFKSRLKVIKNRDVDVDGINTYYFRNLFTYLSNNNITIPYYLPFIARKEVQNFDIIHIHEHRTLLAIFVSYYAKKYNIPYIIQAHGSVLPFLQKQKLKKLFDVCFGYSILKNATKTIALHETEAFQYKEMGVFPTNIKIIPNGINLYDYNNFLMQGTFRTKFSINPDCKIILYIGRIHKNKGLDFLINSFSIFLKKLPNSKLVIIGPDDGFKTELELLIANLNISANVLFTGFIDKDTKIAALTDANIFVTPNFSGFPVTFLEACVFGLPIVTTKKGDNLNWIDNKIGYVTEYDENDFCKGMVNILTNNTVKEYFSTNGKELIRTEFSMDNFIDKVKSIYEECILINSNF